MGKVPNVTNDQFEEILKSETVFRVIDPSLSIPMKFKIILD